MIQGRGAELCVLFLRETFPEHFAPEKAAFPAQTVARATFRNVCAYSGIPFFTFSPFFTPSANSVRYFASRGLFALFRPFIVTFDNSSFVSSSRLCFMPLSFCAPPFSGPFFEIIIYLLFRTTIGQISAISARSHMLTYTCRSVMISVLSEKKYTSPKTKINIRKERDT